MGYNGNAEGKKLCWVMTGAGHFLRESMAFLPQLLDFCAVDLFFTRAGREVAARYRVDPIKHERCEIFCENDYSSSHLIYFSSGRYRALVIAPATSNTVAKCALGIADSLASNFFAQAGKSCVPAFVLPTDTTLEMTSTTPSGREIPIRPRPIDLVHAETLAAMQGVRILQSPDELEQIRAYLLDV